MKNFTHTGIVTVDGKEKIPVQLKELGNFWICSDNFNYSKIKDGECFNFLAKRRLDLNSIQANVS